MPNTLYLTTGEELLVNWLRDIMGYRDEPTIVKRCRKNHTCILGCAIEKGDSYMKFDFVQAYSGYHLSVGICQRHQRNLFETTSFSLNQVLSSEPEEIAKLIEETFLAKEV